MLELVFNNKLDLNKIRKDFGWSVGFTSEKMGVTPQTWWAWSKNPENMPSMAKKLLNFYVLTESESFKKLMELCDRYGMESIVNFVEGANAIFSSNQKILELEKKMDIFAKFQKSQTRQNVSNSKKSDVESNMDTA